jgi:hypothetical protein
VTDDHREAEVAAEVEEAVDVESIARERDEYLDALQRLKAEFDNYRKRVVGGGQGEGGRGPRAPTSGSCASSCRCSTISSARSRTKEISRTVSG